MPRHPALRRLATFLLALAASSAALAGPSDHSLYVRATFTETVEFAGLPPCFGTGSLRGSGHSAPFGNFTVTAQDCINPLGSFDPGRPGSNSFAFASATPGLSFTAANGDRLFLTYSGNAVPQANGPHRLTGQFVVTGGTGAFFAATGGGIIFGTEDLNQLIVGQGEITVLGVVRY